MRLSVHPVSPRTLRKEFRPTLRLALPLIFAEIGWMSMGVVDTIMVGRLSNRVSTTAWRFSVADYFLAWTPSSRKRMDATTLEMPGTRS